MNLEGPFGLSVALPFVESAYRNDASLPPDQLSEHRTCEHGLAFGVDRSELRLKRRLKSRNKLPVHRIQSSVAANDAKYRRVHGRAEVVDGLRHEYELLNVVGRRSASYITGVEFFVRIGFVCPSTHLQNCIRS